MGKYDTDAKIRKAMQSDVPVSDEARQRIDETLQGVGDTKGSRAKQKEVFWNTRKVIAVCILVLVVSNGKAIYTYAKDLLVKYHLYDEERTDLNMSVNQGVVEFTEPTDMVAGDQKPLSEQMKETLEELKLKVVPHYEKEYKKLETLSSETGIDFLDIQSLIKSDEIPVTLLYHKNLARKPCDIFVDAFRLDGMAKAVVLSFYTEVDEEESSEERRYLDGIFAEKYISDNEKLTAYLYNVEARRFFGCYGYEDSMGKTTWPMKEIYLRGESYGIYLIYNNIEYRFGGIETVEGAKQLVEQLAAGL